MARESFGQIEKSKKPLPSQRSLRSTLKNINAHGKLALFMGAGISMGCGLPSWEELVLRVLNKVWQRDPEMAEVLILERQVLATRYAKQKLASNSIESYTSASMPATLQSHRVLKQSQRLAFDKFVTLTSMIWLKKLFLQSESNLLLLPRLRIVSPSITELLSSIRMACSLVLIET